MRATFNLISTLIFLIWLSITPAHSFFDHEQEVTGNKEIIVLLHGLGRNTTSMWLLASRLEKAGYHVQRIGYDSLHETPDKILKEISYLITKCCQKHTQHVHFVGHSLGGLMVRAYLQNNKINNLGRVVLLGTPNQGTHAADHFSDSWMMNILGPTAKALGTGQHGIAKSLKPPYYPVGIIAGEVDSTFNDMVIPGKDDGVVSVKSTKIDSMTDFIIIKTGHSRMRYNGEVAEQTIEFIKRGMFKR